jgi:sec-independent protein translocase protein TatB
MVSMGAAPQIYAASIGIQDSVFLMLLALVIFGPRRLPEIGRQIGKLMYEFRKVSNDFKFQMEEELRASEEAERQRKLQAALPPASTAALDLPPTPAPAALEAVHEAVPESIPGAQIPIEETSVVESAAPSEPAEDRGEPRRFPPQIQPPSTGQPVAAARPFRPSIPVEPETVAPAVETATEAGSEIRPADVQPDSVHPDSVHPDSVHPDSVHPDSVQPDSVQPGSVQPDSVQPGLPAETETHHG